MKIKMKARSLFSAGVVVGMIGLMMPVAVSSASASTISKAAGIKKAQALITQYLAMPKFVSPGPAINVKKLKGKTIFSIPANSSVPFVQTVDQVMGMYAKALGIKYIDYPNQQQQSQQVAGMNQAIVDKVNAIDLDGGINPAMLAPEIQAAKAVGIPTVDTGERNANQPTAPYVAAYAFAPFYLSGELMAAWAVTQTHGNANILEVTSNADVSSASVQAGMNAELKATCPTCKVSSVNVNPVDWATQLQPTVQGAITGDPGMNYILPVFDAMAVFGVDSAITAAGKVGKIHVASFNGSPSVVNLISKSPSDIITMDVGENTSDVAAAGLDDLMRVMLHMKPGQEVMNSWVIDAANVSQTGAPHAVSGRGYGNAYIVGYAKTWGVAPGKL
jgi:ribose transport system substrate-binding protein